jgi:hypothetical protein
MQRTSSVSPGRALWTAKVFDNDDYIPFLLDISDSTTLPLERVSLKENVSNLINPKQLDFSRFEIDFTNEKMVNPITIKNCVFQSKGRCLNCDTFHELNWEINTCEKCTGNYINFLNKCNTTLIPVQVESTSNFTWQEHEVIKNSTFNEVTRSRPFSVFTATTGTNSNDVQDYLTTNLIQANTQTGNIILFETEIQFSSEEIPPLMYLVWINSMTFSSSPELLLKETAQIGGFEKNTKQFKIYRTVIDLQENLEGFTQNLLNFSVSYKAEFENGTPRSFGLFQPNGKTQVLELSESNLEAMIQDESFNDQITLPMSFNPKWFSQYIFVPYGPFYYVLGNTQNSSIPLISGSNGSVRQPISCPHFCTECVSKVQCTSCESGFYLLNGICHKCAVCCKECVGNPLNCTTCSHEGKLFFFQ